MTREVSFGCLSYSPYPILYIHFILPFILPSSSFAVQTSFFHSLAEAEGKRQQARGGSVTPSTESASASGFCRDRLGRQRRRWLAGRRFGRPGERRVELLLPLRDDGVLRRRHRLVDTRRQEVVFCRRGGRQALHTVAVAVQRNLLLPVSPREASGRHKQRWEARDTYLKYRRFSSSMRTRLR